MAKRKTTVSIILDQRTTTEDGRHPIKLRVIYDRVNRAYSLKIYLTKEEFEKLNSTKRVEPKIKDAKVHCTYYLNAAQEAIDEMEQFSFEAFRERLFPSIDYEAKEYAYVEVLFRDYISELKNEGRVGTYKSYTDALNSLLKFRKKLKWEDISLKFLNAYEQDFISQGKSLTTVGIYLRALRTIYNQAIERGYAKKESYPFGKKKYEIPAGRNIKKALSKSDMQKIIQYDPMGNSSLEFGRDIFVLSYLCNGLNIKDICLIKKSDIEKDILTFERAKTSNTRKSNAKKIIVHLNPLAKEIITKYQSVSGSKYLFPFLEDATTPEEVRERVKNLTKRVNKFMKRIGQELGLGDSIRTYTARHTYSTVLKRSGVSIEYISESLGHSDLKTTESYLDSFDDETKKKYSDLLTDF